MNNPKLKLTLFLLWIGQMSFGQANLYVVSMGYIRERLMQFESIKIDWKMTGRVQAEFNEGLNNLNEGNEDVAVANFSNALAQDSNSWQILYHRAIAFRRVGKLDRSEEDMRRALKFENSAYEAWIELGKTNLLQRENKKAIQNFEMAIKLNEKNPLGYYWCGEAYFIELIKVEAKSYFEKCLSIDTNYSGAKLKLTLLKLLTNKDEEQTFTKELNEILKSDSIYDEALLYRGLLNSEKHSDLAYQDFSRLVRRNPMNLFFKTYHAILLIQLERYSEAFSEMQKILQANAKKESSFKGQQTFLDKQIDLQYAGYYTLSKIYGLTKEKDIEKVKKGYCLMLIGKDDDAINNLSDVKGFDSSSLCLFLMGIAYEHQGNHERAWKLYNQALKFDDQIIDAHKKVGIYHSNVKDWSKAEKEFTKTLSLNNQLFNVYKLRGVARFHQKNYRGAIEDFDRCLQVDSTDIEAKQNKLSAFSMIAPVTTKSTTGSRGNEEITGLQTWEISRRVRDYLEKKDTIQAIKFLNEIIKIQPNRETYLAHAKSLIEMKRYPLAVVDLDSVIKKNSFDLEALDLRVICNSKLKNYNQVAKDLKILTYFNPDIQGNYFVSYRNYINAKDTTSAKGILKAFYKRWPENIDVELTYADVYTSERKFDSANYMLDRVLDKQKKIPNYRYYHKAYYLKSQTLLAKQNNNESLKAINMALKGQSDNSDYLFWKFKVLMKLNQRSDAEKILRILKRKNYPSALQWISKSQ